MSKTILIIGGTRFIGPYVVRRLSHLGHQVILYHRGEHESLFPETVKHVRSINAAIPIINFEHSLLKSKPDIVIHMVAMGEKDALAAFRTFDGYAEKMIWLSSGDVYAAYGRFLGIEPGLPEYALLTENSPLRKRLFPYRNKAKSKDDLNYYYEKILVERNALRSTSLPGVVLRLPKVYGPESNNDLSTVFNYRNQPNWRWTHGFVENVAEAIVIAALSPASNGQTYNVGEKHTLTISERLAYLPNYQSTIDNIHDFNFNQSIAYDTSKIRSELGFREIYPEKEAMQKTIKEFLAKR